MKSILAVASTIWIAGLLLMISPISFAQFTATNSVQLGHSPFFFFDISALIIFVTVVLSTGLGIVLHVAFTQYKYFSSLALPSVFRRQYQRIDTKASPVNVFESSSLAQPSLGHYHASKNSECKPFGIINRQLANFSRQRKNVQFIGRIDAPSNVKIKICATWFESVICELLTNATQHNGDKPNLRVTLSTSIRGSEFIITLCDNGSGIAENITNSLANQANKEGNGNYINLHSPLNLYNIDYLLKRMNATLHVTSARSYLTRITITLPIFAAHTLLGANIDALASVTTSNKAVRSEPATSMINNDKPDSQRTSAILARVEECVAAYHTNKGSPCQVNSRESNKFIRQFSHMLNTHYTDENFNKAAAIKLMLMTDKTLTRRLQRHYKLGFVDILRKFRLRKATRLLLNAEKVTSVALDTGFSSPSYFTQCFKAEFGFAPSLLTKHECS